MVWTPDGTELIAAARRREKADEELLESDIFAFAVADGAMRQLTDRNGPDGEPAVSPDGKLIAYTGFDERYQGYQNALLYVMNRDGSGKRALSTKLDNSVGSPTWSADGKGIYVQYDDKGDTKVGLFALDGSWRVVASHLGSGMMAYSGGSYSVARNGSVAYTLSTPSIPSNVAVVGSGASATPVSVTSLNVELLATRTLGAVEEIWYESSKDGAQDPGWIIKPPGFDAKKKYPLILEIHGGPLPTTARFDDEKQIMAANGFVVLYTNPRGSTSYGEEFGNLIHHAYPGDDFFDLNSGVDAVIAKGYIDEKNLFVTGGSGGGVLTAWMIGHTDRFRAALAFYPVINWESFSLTADMAPLSVKNWFPGMPWDHKDNYGQALAAERGEEREDADADHDRRGGLPHADVGERAVLQGAQDERRGGSAGARPRGAARHPALSSHAASKLATLAGWFEKHRAPVQ
ncbi:MAG: S9 family peptidase [Gemmatimonadetes bacterium]|nr:S9 family peptidase [Gemmatimonadota bacterium]